MGRRRIEVIRAKVSDMHMNGSDPYMDVDGKGHKYHRMPFAPDTYDVLSKYLDWRQKVLLEAMNDHIRTFEAYEPLIIWAKKRHYGTYDPIKGTAYDAAITHAVSNDCGIRFSNHDLRRTFGRELYFTGGVDIWSGTQ